MGESAARPAGTEVHEIATPRLVLRRWCRADRVEFARINADLRVMRHFPAPLERLASDAMVERIEAAMVECGWGLWAVEVKDVAPFIGFVGLHRVPATLPFAP